MALLRRFVATLLSSAHHRHLLSELASVLSVQTYTSRCRTETVSPCLTLTESNTVPFVDPAPFQDGVPHLHESITAAIRPAEAKPQQRWNAPLPAAPSPPLLSLPLSLHPHQPHFLLSHHVFQRRPPKTRPNPSGAGSKRRETISTPASVAPTTQVVHRPQRWNVEAVHLSP